MGKFCPSGSCSDGRGRSSVDRLSRDTASGRSARSSAWIGNARRISPRALARKIGPLLPEHQVGRDNLRAAFPQKSAAEIEQILGGVWDNLGPGFDRVRPSRRVLRRRRRHPDAGCHHLCAGNVRTLRRRGASGKAMLAFAAHLANWELPAVVGKRIGGDSRDPLSAAEYRRRQPISSSSCARR